MAKMSFDTIDNFEELISNTLKKGEKILNTEITRLTKPGENYGSTMLRVDIKLRNQATKDERTLNVVAKLIPENEMMLQAFNTQVTYKNELEFYRTIVPTLQKFQLELGVKDVITCVAKFIGGRINLNPGSDIVDKNAVILLENLKVQGYQSLPRTAGCDLKTARIIIKEISTLHAVPLALKIHKPKVFATNIMPNVQDFIVQMPPDALQKDIKLTIDDNKLLEKSLAAIERGSDKSVREPWGTFIQNDLWCGNALVKFVKGEPVNAKIVDYQNCEYKSPLRDLIFFLFSSVKIEVLEQHLDDLIDYYYQNFIQILSQLNVDTKPFSRQSFNKELKLSTKLSEYYHVLWMLNPIHVPESDVKELSEMTEEDWEKPREMTKLHKEVILFVTKECAKRGWI